MFLGLSEKWIETMGNVVVQIIFQDFGDFFYKKPLLDEIDDIIFIIYNKNCFKLIVIL